MLWHEKTWSELDKLDRNTALLIPLGSCEQHGHHLPLFVDTIQVDAIARCVEANLREQVLLLPTLWLGSSHHHQDFPGTVSVPPLLYAQLIQEIARSALRSGFTRLFFLNGHGGNRAPASSALTQLIAEDDAADNAYLVLASWWEVGGDAIRSDKLELEQSAISHACEFETSLMLALRPELVDMTKITLRRPILENNWFHSEDDSRKRVSVFRRFHRLTASGGLGHPESASAEKGRAIFDGVTDQITAFLKSFSDWPMLPPLGPVNT